MHLLSLFSGVLACSFLLPLSIITRMSGWLVAFFEVWFFDFLFFFDCLLFCDDD
jgi:hypothetical protein